MLLCVCICNARPKLANFLFLSSPLQYDAQVYTTPLIHQTRLRCLIYFQCWCLKSCGGREGGVMSLCVCICSAHPELPNFLFLSSPLQYDAQVHTTPLIHQTRLQCLMYFQCWCLKSCGGREGGVTSLCVCICSARPELANFIFLSLPLQYDAQVHATPLIHQTRLRCLMCLQHWYLKQCSCGGREGRVASLGLLEPRPPPGVVFPRLKPGQGAA